mmetsp:Transcript_64477/g.165896  ORF Transcript_64477/g.165896 Transcript_64477/m.165896 type:complete len:370 (+) Transcript_64477:97-1206(+)
MVHLARTPAVLAEAIHPLHVLARAPVADDRRHARLQRRRELHQAVPPARPVIVRASAQGAVALSLARLEQSHLHGCQATQHLVHREGCFDLEWEPRVNARCAGPVDSVIPSAAVCTVACPQASRVVVSVHRGDKGELVRLLDVYLRAADATDLGCVAVVIRALRRTGAARQGNEVQRRIAATTCPGEVHGVSQRLAEQIEREVLLALIGTLGAGGTKVGPTTHGGAHAVVEHTHGSSLLASLVPGSVDNCHRAIALQGDVPCAHLVWLARCIAEAASLHPAAGQHLETWRRGSEGLLALQGVKPPNVQRPVVHDAEQARHKDCEDRYSEHCPHAPQLAVEPPWSQLYALVVSEQHGLVLVVALPGDGPS